jgi:hypothetical protein
LHEELAARGVTFCIVGAHGSARDLLRADGLEEKVGKLDRATTLESVLAANAGEGGLVSSGASGAASGIPACR